MACTIEEQNNLPFYSEQIRKAACELTSSIPILLDFVATLKSTGNPDRLQKLSELVLAHVSSAEKYVLTSKEQLSQVVFYNLKTRQKLEDNMQKKDTDLRSKRNCIKRKETEFEEKQITVNGAKYKFQAEQDKYRSLLQRGRNKTVGSVVCAGVLFACTIATAGSGAWLALGCQYAVATWSVIDLDMTRRACNSARDDWDRSKNKLNEHQKEIEDLLKQYKKLQTEYNTCVKEKTTIDENYNKVLKLLKETTHIFELVLKFRQFISIMHGKIEIIQETRKDFLFQNRLRLPLVEICEHLTSTFGSKLLANSGIQQLCMHLKEQVAILPNLSSDDQNDGFDDYI